ncbi:FG-GAP repeat domain-containing protein [Acanthopleuribacter pedis]|uniref:VCBS repeat-containing protein n=1 Tax=Acanthopleuribacter pedis TaxID=442870 RepID=A0A8J7U4Y8_9BACT|nr:VCBS repeat-containing protein [Acanthopleuribacter pedis]MBO1320279.1 VCBS repeat-containing protein [Acanthopleuribacter pedis]
MKPFTLMIAFSICSLVLTAGKTLKVDPPPPGHPLVLGEAATFFWEFEIKHRGNEKPRLFQATMPSWMTFTYNDTTAAKGSHTYVLQGQAKPDALGDTPISLVFTDPKGNPTTLSFVVRVVAAYTPGDFDGDGTADFSFREGNSFYYLNRQNEATYLFFDGMPANSVPLVGRFDHDNRADIAVWNPATGDWSIYTSMTGYSHPVQCQFGERGTDTPFVGDVDGDGLDDLIIHRFVPSYDEKSRGVWFTRSLNNDSVDSLSFSGYDDDIPLVGDFNGNGTVDVAVKQLRNNRWTIHEFYGETQLARFPFSMQDSDKIAPADYDGDGTTDIAIRRVTEEQLGAWIIRSRNGSLRLQNFATQPNDIEVPADYNGDGLADHAVYRPSTGEFMPMIREKVKVISVAPANADVVPLMAQSFFKRHYRR